MRGRFSPEAFGFGVFLATVGAVFLLSNIGLIEAIPVLRKIWPLFLVIWGIAEILASKAPTDSGSGGIE